MILRHAKISKPQINRKNKKKSRREWKNHHLSFGGLALDHSLQSSRMTAELFTQRSLIKNKCSFYPADMPLRERIVNKSQALPNVQPTKQQRKTHNDTRHWPFEGSAGFPFAVVLLLPYGHSCGNMD